jgi:hypothetical protein
MPSDGSDSSGPVRFNRCLYSITEYWGTITLTASIYPMAGSYSSLTLLYRTSTTTPQRTPTPQRLATFTIHSTSTRWLR